MSIRTETQTISTGAVTLSKSNTTLKTAVIGYGVVGTYLIDNNEQSLGAALFGPTSLNFTLHNKTVIESSGTATLAAGILLASPGTVFNAGKVIGSSGILILDNPAKKSTAYTDNSGLIDATLGAGIYLQGKGSVTNSGTVDAVNGIVLGTASAGFIINTGLIDAASSIDITDTYAADFLRYGVGIYSAATGSVSNTGTIFGNHAGIVYTGTTARGNVTNAGYIKSSSGLGVYLSRGGTISNSGTIIGGQLGVDLSRGGTISNSGTIIGGQSGIYLDSGFLYNSGLIMGEGTGIRCDYQTHVYNYGTISATTVGISGGAVFNYRGGVISGNVNGGAIGAYGIDEAYYVYNAGLITAGVIIPELGSVFNSGTIQGGVGVNLGGYLTNAGYIGGYISFNHHYAYRSRLVITPTARFGSSGPNLKEVALELAAEGKKIGTLNLENFRNIGSVIIDPKAVWDITGTFQNVQYPNSSVVLLNDGILKESSKDLTTLNGPVLGTGLIELSKQVFTLESTVASTQKIEFTGTAETLALDDYQNFFASIESFSVGDTIDILSFLSGGETHFARGILTLSNDNGGTFALTFASPATLNSDNFLLTNGTLTLTKKKAAILTPNVMPAAASATILPNPLAVYATSTNTKFAPPTGLTMFVHALGWVPTTPYPHFVVVPPLTLQP
jgi:hypothetical protein